MLQCKCELPNLEKIRQGRKKSKCIARFEPTPLHSTHKNPSTRPSLLSQLQSLFCLLYRQTLETNPANVHNPVLTSQLLPSILSSDRGGVRTGISRSGRDCISVTTHHLCCGVMRYLRECGQHDLDFFKDSIFAEFRGTLDAEMKRIQLLGIGTKRRQAEPLTCEEEEILWQTGKLGDHSP